MKKKSSTSTSSDDKEVKAAASPSAAVEFIAAYVRVWAAATFARVVFRAGKELVYNRIVAVAVVPAFFFPTHPVALVVGFGVRIFAMISSLPYLHDSQWWCLQSDAAVLGALVGTLWVSRCIRTMQSSTKRATSPLLDSLCESEASNIVSEVAPTIRILYIFCYFAAGIWKWNEGFMSPKTSCAPIYLIALLERHVPASLIHPRFLDAVTAAAPTLILLVELAIPVLLWIEVRSGIVFASLFHWTIAITPPPNDIASFGVQTIPRLLWLVPDMDKVVKSVQSLVEARGLGGIGIMAFAALTTALQPVTWTGLFDYNVPACAVCAAVAMLAAVSSKPYASALDRYQPRTIKPFAWTLRAIAFLYALVLIPLGIHDMGSANMFSSLQIYGGSNHYLFQTGLLQKVYSELSPETMVGEAFGGGIIRVESTNASYLFGDYGVKYPGELLGHTPRTRQLLVDSGHSGRQFSPMSFACSIGNHPERKSVNTGTMEHTVRKANDGINDHGKSNYFWHDGSSTSFVRWTIPVPEFRNRLFVQTRDRFPDESFFIEMSILPGNGEGDEIFRTTATAARVMITRSFDAKGAEHIECTRLDESGENENDGVCASEIEARLLTPPTNRWLPFLVRKLLLSQPYPIVEKDVGSHKALHCFGP